MARCTEDAILDPVMAFVNENLNNVDWKWKDAAVMALGSIMEGPDPDMLAPYLQPVRLWVEQWAGKGRGFIVLLNGSGAGEGPTVWCL